MKELRSLLTKKYLIVLSIVFLGAFLRFYKLDWGERYFFHPDEYHIAISVNQLSFPDQMHPNFFSYGTFISYLIYFSKQFAVSVGIISENINPILIGRFFSALFSTVTIPVVYLLTKTLTKKTIPALVAALSVAFSPGLIQQAHFATPESSLIFWILLSLLTIIYWLKHGSGKYLFFSALSFGLALSVKISGLIFFPVYALSVLLKKKLTLQSAGKSVLLFAIFTAASLLTFLVIYPYSVLDWQGFRHSFNYESGVGRGDPLVFYTRQFINTTPVLFQYTKILPYVLDPATLIFGTAGVIYSVFLVIKNKFKQKELIIVLSAFLIFFISSSFLFAKWTRFIIPAVPFFAVFTGYMISRIKDKRLYKLTIMSVLSFSLVWSLMFFQIYMNQDVRLQANDWVNENLPQQSIVLTEAGNMIEIPVSGSFTKHSFDFYHLDENPELRPRLIDRLVEVNYFIVQSRRMFYNHQRLPDMYPLTNRFYEKLFNEELGFKKIAEFNSYPKLEIGKWKLEIRDEGAEETWTVFDHPVVRVYEKTHNHPVEYYENILGEAEKSI